MNDDSSRKGAINTTVDPRMARWVTDVLLGSPVARAIGIRLVALEVDRVVMALPFKPDNVTLARIVHGGVIATLIDIVGAAASASGADGDAVRGGATGNLAIHYLAPAEGCDLEAEAIVIKRGKRQTVSDITVRSGDAVIAKALLTSAIFIA
ncbi:MAG: PaaI family thioesterase [Burkholderiaceae bacterium]